MQIHATSLVRLLGKGMIIFASFVVVLILLGAGFAFTPRDRQVLLQRYKRIESNGTERQYLLSPSKTKVPKKLIVGLHGFGYGGRSFAFYSALHNSVNDDTMVVYPSALTPTQKGTKSGWNAEFCCGSGWLGKVDDVAFIDSLISLYANQYNIAPANIFITGFSNGAFMAQKFATDKPTHIGGVAAVSGVIGTTRKALQPHTPVPILLMHGTKDATIPFSGGATASEPNFVWLPFSDTQQAWQDINGSKAPTKVIVLQDGTHAWAGWRLANFWHHKTYASNQVVSFFNKLN